MIIHKLFQENNIHVTYIIDKQEHNDIQRTIAVCHRLHNNRVVIHMA